MRIGLVSWAGSLIRVNVLRRRRFLGRFRSIYDNARTLFRLNELFIVRVDRWLQELQLGLSGTVRIFLDIRFGILVRFLTNGRNILRLSFAVVMFRSTFQLGNLLSRRSGRSNIGRGILCMGCLWGTLFRGSLVRDRICSNRLCGSGLLGGSLFGDSFFGHSLYGISLRRSRLNRSGLSRSSISRNRRSRSGIRRSSIFKGRLFRAGLSRGSFGSDSFLGSSVRGSNVCGSSLNTGNVGIFGKGIFFWRLCLLRVQITRHGDLYFLLVGFEVFSFWLLRWQFATTIFGGDLRRLLQVEMDIINIGLGGIGCRHLLLRAISYRTCLWPRFDFSRFVSSRLGYISLRCNGLGCNRLIRSGLRGVSLRHSSLCGGSLCGGRLGGGRHILLGNGWGRFLLN